MKGRVTTDKELNDMVYSDNPWERRTAAMNGYGLDILVHDDFYDVRKAVAEEEHCPEDVLIELVKDDNDCVRDAAYRKMRHLVYRRLFY